MSIFKPEDFSDVIDNFGDREFITSGYGNHEELIKLIANQANKILEEKNVVIRQPNTNLQD